MENNLSYYPAIPEKKRAVTLVTHGLNVQPLAMLAFINWLTNEGSDVYLVALSGHHQNGTDIQNITASLWREEMLAGYAKAKEASIHHAVPLYFLGYSLGALLGQSLMLSSHENISFDKQILIAPAVAIRSRSYLIKCLFFLGKKTMIRSYTPQAYRVNKALPLHIYQLLFAQERKFLKAGFSGLNIPTLVLIDPKDELISYRKLVRYTNQFSLTNYEIVALRHELTGRISKYHHQIIDEQTMGRENWKMSTEKMKQFLFT